MIVLQNDEKKIICSVQIETRQFTLSERSAWMKEHD